MAGIGFRLKRLIADETYGGWLRAHIYGAVVSSGPWLLSVFTLAALALLSRDIMQDRALDVFRSIVIYCYTFSLITTGGVQMVVTRHVADALYLGDESALAGRFAGPSAPRRSATCCSPASSSGWRRSSGSWSASRPCSCSSWWDVSGSP